MSPEISERAFEEAIECFSRNAEGIVIHRRTGSLTT
jgi:hypothetical protein